MKITRDPRCPDHPDFDVYVTLGRLPIWHCSACRRPLGAASANVEGWLAFGVPWRRWPMRRASPVEQTVGATDVAWCSHVGRGRLPPGVTRAS